MPASELSKETVALEEETGEQVGWPGYPGLSDEEVFKLVTMPDAVDDVDDWGIPAEVPPEETSDALQVSFPK